MRLRRSLFLLYALFALGPPALFAQAQRQGTITSTQCVPIDVSAQSTVGIQVAGTWTGTLQPKISIQGQSPANVQVTPSTSSTAQSTITANGVYTAKVAGGSTFLLCGASVASGTAYVYLNASQGVAVIFPEGSITADGVIFPTAGATAPSPVGTNSCAGNPSGWVQNAAGTYQTQFGVDATQTSTSDSTFPGGLHFCRSVVFNSGAGANPTGSGNAQAFSAVGVFSSSPNRHFLTQYYYANDAADATTYTTPNIGIQYGDFEINGTPTLNTTFVSTLRFRMDDNRTGGGKPRVWSVYQGDTEKTAAHDITNCGGVGINGYATGAPCYSIFYGQQGAALSANEDETGAIYDVFSGGTKDAGNHALNATGNVFHALVQGSTGNRFANNNGFTSEDFGTASGYYNFVSKGVNSGGTASGFNAFQGPTTLGQIAHATSGYQLDITGGIIQAQTDTTTALINNMLMTLTLNPGSAKTGASNVLSLVQTSSPTQNISGRIRGIFSNVSPGGSATLTRIEAGNFTAVGTNTAMGTNIAVFADAEPTNTSGTTAANQAIRVQHGQAASGGTITQNDGIFILAPSTTGTNTHSAALHIQQNQSVNTGSNNPDGWAILLDGTADKSKFGLLFTNSACAANGTAANPSVVSCGGAPAGKFSCATNSSAGTCQVNTTAVTAASQIFLTPTAVAGTLGVTCNTAPTVVPAITLNAISAGTSFTINSDTFTTNPTCYDYWILN